MLEAVGRAATGIEDRTQLEHSAQVQWSQQPRPVGEFFGGFAAPKAGARLGGRVKCNLYNFRANYALLLSAVLAISLFRRWSSWPPLSLCALGCLCLNDTFATGLRCFLARMSLANVWTCSAAGRPAGWRSASVPVPQRHLCRSCQELPCPQQAVFSGMRLCSGPLRGP